MSRLGSSSPVRRCTVARADLGEHAANRGVDRQVGVESDSMQSSDTYHAASRGVY